MDFLWSLVLKTAAPWHSFRSPSPCFSSLVCHPAFCLYSDLHFCLLSSCLLTLPFLGISLILLPHAFCHGPSLEFFSCSLVSRLPLPLPRWLLSPPEPLARLPLQSSCASASSLCVNGSGHSSNDAEQRRQEKGPFGKSFIGPNVAASGVSEEGVFWLTLKLNQTAYFMDKKEVW